jgi:hypothetical protein
MNTAGTTITAANIRRRSTSEKITGEDMSADDLRKRLETLIERTRASKVSSCLEREYAELAREAIERLEAAQMDSQDILYGGSEEIDVRECEIAGGSVDIREFTCRRV